MIDRNLELIYLLAMVSRFLILSGIPLSRMTICDEIQNMISFLVENLNPYEWDIFEFVTKKEGRRGPSKEECIEYYNDK